MLSLLQTPSDEPFPYFLEVAEIVCETTVHMHILGAGRSTIIQEKVTLPYAKSLNNRTVWNNLWILSLTLCSSVSQMKVCKERPEGREREGWSCGVSQGWHLNTHTRQWYNDILLWYSGSRSHKSQNILPHSAYAWEVCFGHRGHTAFRHPPLERGCSASHRLLSSSRASHRASSHNSATVTKAPQQLWLLPSLLFPSTFLKEDLKGVPDVL